MHTVEKIQEGRYDSLRVTRSEETVVRYTPLKKGAVVEGGECSEDGVREENPLEAKVVELHGRGLTNPEIAEEAQTSVYHVGKILGCLALEPNKPSDKHRQDVIALCNQGMSVGMIADRTGLSVPTVRMILREEGLAAPKGKEKVKAKVLELHRRGLKVSSIAAECGISAPTARRIVAGGGTEARAVVAEPEVDAKGMVRSLWNSGKGVDDISLQTGIPCHLVRVELGRAMRDGRIDRPFFSDADVSVMEFMLSRGDAVERVAESLRCPVGMVAMHLEGRR